MEKPKKSMEDEKDGPRGQTAFLKGKEEKRDRNIHKLATWGEEP